MTERHIFSNFSTTVLYLLLLVLLPPFVKGSDVVCPGKDLPCEQQPVRTPYNCTLGIGETKCPCAYGRIYANPYGGWDDIVVTFDYTISSQAMMIFPSNKSLIEDCSVTIDGNDYDEKDANKIIPIGKGEKVTIINDGESACILEYVLYKPCDLSKNLTSPSGQLKSPIDPMDIFKYRPNVKYLWTLDVAKNGSGVDLFMNQVDLDGQSMEIIDNVPMDFILVGKGADVLSGYDVMFYGKLEPVVQVTLDSPTAHVYLVTGPAHVLDESQGFHVNYTSTGYPVTPPPSTTAAPSTVPPEIAMARVSLIGMSLQEAVDNVLQVASVLAKMSKLYADEKGINIKGNGDIKVDDVNVLMIVVCKPKCEGRCSAYDFTVSVKNTDDQWAFRTENLEEMINTDKWKYMWTEMTPSCKICLDQQAGWYWYFAIVAMVLIVPSLALLAMRHFSLQRWSKRQEALRQEKEREEEDDRRRKLSGLPSLLGGSISSRGSMPIPNSRRRRRKDDEEGEGDYAAGDDKQDCRSEEGSGSMDSGVYQLFDPDVGRIDISQFGKERDLVSGLNAISCQVNRGQVQNHCYSNSAFVPDDDEVKGGGGRGNGDSSSDSDTEVSIFRRDHNREQQQQQETRHVRLTQDTTAEVHAIGETVI